jgi:hypothetical protein
MGDDGGRNEESSPNDRPRRPPLQFSLRGLLILTAAVALLFGTLRWLNVPPEASVMILVSLIIAAVAAIGLMVAILKE